MDLASNISGEGDPRFQRFWNYKPTPKICDWLAKSKKVNVLVGANKSMKTTMGVLKAIVVYTGIVPPAMRKAWVHSDLLPINRPRHVRIIVQNYSKHWPETIRPLLLDDEAWGMLPKTWAQNYNPEEHTFYGPDGSYLSIISVDPHQSSKDRIASILRGPIMDHTYIDELNAREVYTESLTRNATAPDGPATVDLGFCPQEGYDWTYEDLYLTGYHRSDEKKPEDECNPTINVLRVGMKDNPSVSQAAVDAYINTLKPWEVAYRVYGKYSRRAGDPFYDVATLDKWKQQGKFSDGEPYCLINKKIDVEEGTFDARIVKADPMADEEIENVWRFWEQPKNGEYYMMVIDSAEGHKDGDWNNADIWRCSHDGQIDINFPVQVAQFHKQLIKPGDFIEECCCMANRWGEILLVYEVNNTSGGVVRDRSRNYPNLYTRLSEKKEIQDQTRYLGWYSDVMSKPAALEESYALMRMWDDDSVGLRSNTSVDEMLSYEERIERNDITQKGKRVFGPVGTGLHDDTVSTFYIMSYVLRFQKEFLTESDLSDKAESEQYVSPLEKKARERNELKRTKLKPKKSLKELRHGR